MIIFLSAGIIFGTFPATGFFSFFGEFFKVPLLASSPTLISGVENFKVADEDEDGDFI